MDLEERKGMLWAKTCFILRPDWNPEIRKLQPAASNDWFVDETRNADDGRRKNLFYPNQPMRARNPGRLLLTVLFVEIYSKPTPLLQIERHDKLSKVYARCVWCVALRFDHDNCGSTTAMASFCSAAIMGCVCVCVVLRIPLDTEALPCWLVKWMNMNCIDQDTTGTGNQSLVAIY